jgi:ATP-dependent DNA helicase PIF1
MELSKEQQIAFDKYVQGHNIFITGPGGSGKSALIRLINEDAYKKFKDIHVTALTGCAAVLLNCKAKKYILQILKITSNAIYSHVI